MGTPSHSYGTSLAMGSHSVTCHPTQVNAPRLNPSQYKLVLDLPTPEGWKADLTYLAMHRPGVELVIFR